MGKKAERKQAQQQLVAEWRRIAKRRKRRLNAQQKAVNIRAKYGPARCAAPVVIKSLETGEVRRVVRQADVAKSRRQAYSPLLDELARQAGFESYAHYLASAHWRELRQRVLKRDGYRCRRCGKKKDRLVVHHDTYAHLGTDHIDMLKTFCSPCHRRIHRY